MIEIDWKKDYRGEFVCPNCDQCRMSLAGFERGKKIFYCKDCQRQTTTSINLNRRSLYLESRLKDERVDWKKDYQGEFICPECQNVGMTAWGIKKPNNKRIFRCSTCRHTCQESSQIDIQAIADPTNLGVIWYINHRIKGFICPECQAEDIYLETIVKAARKKRFLCKNCRTQQYESIQLTTSNLSHYSDKLPPVKPFNYDDPQWDLRGVNPNFDLRNSIGLIVDFTAIYPNWFKQEVKKYIQHLCKASNSFSTIQKHLSTLRIFSQYLNQRDIVSFKQINRSLILDYLAQEHKVTSNKLGGLRSFFITGTVRGWFNLDLDIIRDADYPKRHRGNPDPISDTVREQVEQNLYKLPEPIARMWIICYFTAMRPSELALLKQDCLVQEGQQWKIVWYRKKTNDYHEVPISRTIAKVIQEQQEYIQNLWGNNWDYLFCHYHGISSTDPQAPKLEPVKRVIPPMNNPLILAIRCLIQALNIRNENGQIAQFSPKLLRSTRLTQLFEQGHDLSVVSAWAGHKQFATTSTYYTEVSCELMEREAGHIQKALVNSDGQHLPYESLPKSFWKTPTAHKLELSGTHINTPIYGFCGLSLNQDCYKFRACYTCSSFVAVPEKLSQYIKTRDELRTKQSNALDGGQEVLVEQFGRQADQLDKIIAGLQEAA